MFFFEKSLYGKTHGSRAPKSSKRLTNPASMPDEEKQNGKETERKGKKRDGSKGRGVT